ncbi:MAG TPA: glycosyltransferase [Pedobacter sp.]
MKRFSGFLGRNHIRMNKRIAFISDHASPMAVLGSIDSGGQNVYVAELAKRLAETGLEVDVYTRKDAESLRDVVDYAPGVRIINIEAGPQKHIAKEFLLEYMGEFYNQMLCFIESEELTYNLIHANFFMSGLVALRLKAKLNIPFVITFHALGKVRKLHQKEADKFPEERGDIELDIARAAERIIAECPQDRDDLIEHYQVDPNKITIIPCGYNPDQFYPVDKLQCRQRLGLKADDKIILQLGRIVPRKGIDNVIEAFVKVCQEIPNAKLLIVGGEEVAPGGFDKDELMELKKLAVALNVADRTTFVGQKEREVLRYYYNAADVFVTTPWYEPFGITPLEAMACGTPVIGSDVGGIKYSVQPGITGLLVPPKRADALADKIINLLQDENRCNQMSKNAIAHAARHFTWKGIASKMADLYQDCYLDNEMDSSLIITKAFKEASEIALQSEKELSGVIARAADVISYALKKGSKILVCGNGGSAAESQHLVAELVGRFEIPERPGLPALSLNSDTVILTAWANDFGFDQVFARQVQAYGKPGDVLISFSTSGNSENIINAISAANEIGISCINLLGKDGGEAAGTGLIDIIVPSKSTQRIQEIHLQLVHLLCTLVEIKLFKTRTGAAFEAKVAPLRQVMESETKLPVTIAKYYGN